jgi:hypothetical protein
MQLSDPRSGTCQEKERTLRELYKDEFWATRAMKAVSVTPVCIFKYVAFQVELH